MICKNCGKEIADNAKFCGYCGEKVEDASININSDYSWINETQPKNILDDSEFKPFNSLNSYAEEPKPTDEENLKFINEVQNNYNDLKPFSGLSEEKDDIDEFEEFKPFTDLDEEDNTKSLVAIDNSINEVENDYSDLKPFPGLNETNNKDLKIENEKVEEKSDSFTYTNQDYNDFIGLSNKEENKLDQVKEESINNDGVKEYQTLANPYHNNNEDFKVDNIKSEEPNFNTEVSEPLTDVQVEQPNLEETIRIEQPSIQDNFKIDKLEDKIEENKKIEEKQSNNNNSKFLIVILILIILGLAGFIVYDKFINNDVVETPIDETNKESNTVKENLMTEVEALAIVQSKYSSIYGETFNTMYNNLITNNDSTGFQTLFTQNAIDKLKLNTTYTTGLFGTTNQTIRQLNIVSYNDNYIVAVGKNDTDLSEYYISFKNVNNTWYIDMFE